MKLQIEIVTPEKMVFKDQADEILVPTTQGQIGILPHHVKLLTQVTSGELVIRNQNQEQYLAITGGFLEVANNTVRILADYAIKGEDVSVAQAQEAKKRAENLLAEKTSEKDFAKIEADLQKSLLELKVANKKRPRSHQINNQ